MAACIARTVLNEVRGEGAVNCGVLLEYDAPLQPDSVSPSTFAVQGRTVENAYVSAAAEPGQPGPGRYVVLELDPVPLLERVRGRNEHIYIRYRSLALRQARPIPEAEDMKDCIAVRNRILGAERFRQFRRGTLQYNLFVPENYDPAKKYPLVLFIHDAGCEGADPLYTLTQGLGAVAFASPEDQRECPCFVLAPQVPANTRMTTDDFTVTPELEEIMDTVRFVMEQYAIDPGRVLTTGQSMGCMASCELLIRYPAFFAGALLVAGQWSPERMAEKALDNNIWILVSAGDRGAFPGMNAVTEAMAAAGAQIETYHWDGKAPGEVLEAQAQGAADAPGHIKYTVFDKDSVVNGSDSGPGANHGGTWALVYTIGAVRRWLLRQERQR